MSVYDDFYLIKKNEEGFFESYEHDIDRKCRPILYRSNMGVTIEDFKSAYTPNQLEKIVLDFAEKVAGMSKKNRGLYVKTVYIDNDSVDNLVNILVEIDNSMLLYNTENIDFVCVVKQL